MTTKSDDTPADKLRALISERRKSAMVLAAGLGPVLDVLDAYIVETDARLEVMEAMRLYPE